MNTMEYIDIKTLVILIALDEWCVPKPPWLPRLTADRADERSRVCASTTADEPPWLPRPFPFRPPGWLMCWFNPLWWVAWLCQGTSSAVSPTPSSKASKAFKYEIGGEVFISSFKNFNSSHHKKSNLSESLELLVKYRDILATWQLPSI